MPGADDDLLADWRFHDAPRPKGRRRRPAASAREALELTARELRLVLTVLFVIFVTSESWQVFGRLSGVRYAVLIALFAVLAAVLGALGTRKAARATAAPAEGLRRPVPDAARATLARRLRRRAWFEVLVVGLAVSGGFLVLGALVVDETLTRAWATIEDDRGFARLPVSEIWTDRVAGSLEIYPLLDSGLALSEPLLRLVGVLGAFAALLFAVEMLVDDALRRDVLEDLLHDWRAARTVWDGRHDPG